LNYFEFVSDATRLPVISDFGHSDSLHTLILQSNALFNRYDFCVSLTVSLQHNSVRHPFSSLPRFLFVALAQEVKEFYL